VFTCKKRKVKPKYANGEIYFFRKNDRIKERQKERQKESKKRKTERKTTRKGLCTQNYRIKKLSLL
jgi:hypothetical protein